MKKYFLMSLLPIMLFISGFFFTHDASAYFKNNCYAIQYSEAGAGKEGTKTNIYSTDLLCYSGGKLETKSNPKNTIGTGGLIYKTPKFSVSGNSVTLTYCDKGHMKCYRPFYKTHEEVYKLSDYGGDFEKMVKAIDSFVAGIGNPSGCTKVDFGKNDATSHWAGTSSDSSSGSSTGDDGDGDSNYAGDPCYNANANSQTWILCPTMRNLEYTASSMDNMIESWLSVDTNLYNASSPTAMVWEIMRNIANVIMVIVLLVIVFSQLTGIGIDNYGIKKMLPRLIAMAILINLSFIVCELAIDLSNLLGTGFRNLFGAIGQGMLEGHESADLMGKFISTMIEVLMVAAGVGGAVAPTALSVAPILGAGGISTGMIIIVIVLALLVVFAAVAVFFIMLAARMIIIIGCVALAPIAFALYILPNTQELYKKWLNAFKTALVVFPICGAVSGVSYIIKAIVLTSNDIQIWMGVVGMIAPFLVFFMLPSMLRGVLGTLGKVGDALTTMGQGVRSGTSNISASVKSSDRFKTGMEDARERAGALRAQRIQTRLRGRSNLSDRQIRKLRRADDTMLAYENAQLKDQQALSSSNYDARVAAMQAKDYEEGMDNEIALYRKDGVHGLQYGLDSINGRLTSLSNKRDNSGNPVALTADERREVAVLTRAALGEKGGGGKVGGIMRSADTSNDFKLAMGDALQQDSTSRAKLSEKDVAAGMYAESFMKNGTNRNKLEKSEAPATFEEYAGEHRGDISTRINTHEAGLNQSGAALKEYIGGLTKEQCQDIYDTDAYKVLGRNDYEDFRKHASKLGVEGKSVQRVSLENGGRQPDRSGMNIQGTGGGADSVPE